MAENDTPPKGQGPYDSEPHLPYSPNPKKSQESEHKPKASDSPDLSDAEQNVDGNGGANSPAIASEAAGLAAAIGGAATPAGGSAGAASWSTNIVLKGSKAGRLAKGNKGLMAAGGIFGVIVIGIVSFIGFLLPYKVTSIIEGIESRVGQVPQYAVQRRMEYYMSRYLILRTLERSGANVVLSNGNYTYLGTSVPETLYTNWKGAKLEAKMLADRGLKIEALLPEGTPGYAKPTNWRFKNIDPARAGPLDDVTLDRTEARKYINKLTREDTKWSQVLKRHHNRMIMKKYFGIDNWKPFEKDIDRTREKYRDAKKAFKKRVIQKTIGKSSSKFAKYFNCIVDLGPEECRNKIKAPDAPQVDAESLVPNDELDELADDVAERAAKETTEEAESLIAKEFFEVMSKIAAKKVLISTVTLVAGILDFAAKTVQSLESGNLSQVVYDRNASQYIGYTANFLSGSDQLRAGQDVDIQDAQIMTETFNGYEESPVYQALHEVPSYGFLGTANAATEEARTVMKDCNNDGELEPLDSGELVCPERRLIQNKTTFTNEPVWDNVIVPIANFERSTLGALLDLINQIIQSITSFLHVDDAIARIFDLLHIDDAFVVAFRWFLNRVFGVAVTGQEQSGDAYDTLAGGITAMQSSLGGDASATGENSIGGRLLTDAEVAAVNQEMNEQGEYEKKTQTLFARYFDPDNYQSLTGTAVAHMPNSLSSASIQLSSVLAPANIFRSIGNLFMRPSTAQDLPAINPFHALQMGYTSDDLSFDMSPEEIKARYQCDLPVGDRPQNKALTERTNELPFSVRAQTDPCLLEEVVKQSGSMKFTGTYNDGIDASPTSNPVTPVGNVAPSDIVDIPGLDPGAGCHKSIADKATALMQAGAVVPLSGHCWRSPEKQIELRRKHCGPTYYDIYEKPASECNPPTAKPGTSNHEKGLAIDFRNCETRQTACYQWLAVNASKYGFYNLPSEPWHWSVDGK